MIRTRIYPYLTHWKAVAAFPLYNKAATSYQVSTVDREYWYGVADVLVAHYVQLSNVRILAHVNTNVKLGCC